MWNLGDLHIYIFIIPLLMGIYAYRRLDSTLKICLFIIGISGIADITFKILFDIDIYNTLPMNLYIICYNVLWWFAFRDLFTHLNIHKRLLKISIVLSSILILYFLNQVILSVEFSTSALCVSSIHIILLSLLHLNFVATAGKEFELDKISFFPISCGLLLYHGFIISIFVGIYILPPEDGLLLLNFKSIAQIVFNLIFIYIFYNQLKREKY